MPTIKELGLERDTPITTIKYGKGVCQGFDRYSENRVYCKFPGHYDVNIGTGNMFEWITTDEICTEWTPENGWTLK